MNTQRELDRLLVTMDVTVQNFALCEIANDRRLVGAPVDAIMIHYVLSGTMHLDLPGFDRVVGTPGCIVLIPRNLAPAMSANDNPTCEVLGSENCTIRRDGLLIMDAADGKQGDLRVAAGVVMATVSGSFGLLDDLKGPAIEDLSDLPIVRHAYTAMLLELSRPNLGGRALMSALMKICLVTMVRRRCERPGTRSALFGGLSDPRFAGVVASILDDPAAPHTVASLADTSRMSRSTFNRQFNRQFGMSAMEFVAKTRLYEAAQMLRFTPLPIKVIAGSIGYSSRSHFSRAFRDAYGHDPSSFREQAKTVSLDAPNALYGSRSRFGLSPEPTLGVLPVDAHD